MSELVDAVDTKHSLDTIKAYGVNDPRINIDKPVKWIFHRGPTQVAYNTYPTNSTSTSQQIYTATVPSANSIIDSEIKTYHDVNIITTGSIPTGSFNVLNFGSFDALRKNPMQRQMTNIDLKINGLSVPVQPIFYINKQAWYESDKLEDTELSTAPQYLDKFAEYRDYLDYGKQLAIVSNKMLASEA